MDISAKTGRTTTVAARVAGEDIKQGDYVAVLDEVLELPSFFWSCSGSMLPPDEMVKIRYRPSKAGLPFKVLAVCLPFVYVKLPRAELVTLDTRQTQIVRLHRKSARTAWRQLRAAGKKKRKRK